MKIIKKAMAILLSTVTVIGGAIGFSSCVGGEKNIMIISRNAGSGTRSAFEELVQKDGVKLQDATLTGDKEEAGDTGAVISKVETNKTAIGYVSFSSLGDTVKAVKVDGVEATVENVLDGSYGMKRPFILMTSTQYELSPVAQDFFNYCMSVEAQSKIAEAGCIDADREFTTYSTATGTLEGTIKVEGSTSMKDLITALIGAYKLVQPKVTVSGTYNGSSNGRSAVENDSTGNTIGLASSSKTSDKYVEYTLCIDAIAVIVNKENEISNLTLEQLFDIYTGAITKFSQLSES